jgi:hypothetical protein
MNPAQRERVSSRQRRSEFWDAVVFLQNFLRTPQPIHEVLLASRCSWSMLEKAKDYLHVQTVTVEKWALPKGGDNARSPQPGR